MPVVARYYNMCMGGTDRFDQLLASFDFHRKTERWTMAFHCYALNCVGVQAYIMYKLRMKEINNINLLTHDQFRTSLVTELLNYFSSTSPSNLQIVPANRKKNCQWF